MFSHVIVSSLDEQDWLQWFYINLNSLKKNFTYPSGKLIMVIKVIELSGVQLIGVKSYAWF